MKKMKWEWNKNERNEGQCKRTKETKWEQKKNKRNEEKIKNNGKNKRSAE